MIEVADVFRRFAADYLSAHGTSMLPSHRRAIEDILNCRTAALGGQVWRCEACGTEVFSYHSCIMGKFSNGESAGGPPRANSGCSPFCSPLLHVLGKPVIFSAGRNEPSSRYCGTRASEHPDCIGAHSISVHARLGIGASNGAFRRSDGGWIPAQREHVELMGTNEARKLRQSPPIGQHWTRSRSPTPHY